MLEKMGAKMRESVCECVCVYVCVREREIERVREITGGRQAYSGVMQGDRKDSTMGISRFSSNNSAQFNLFYLHPKMMQGLQVREEYRNRVAVIIVKNYIRLTI